LEALAEAAPKRGAERRMNSSRKRHGIPLSVYQRPLYELAEFAPARKAYAERFAFAIDGELNVDACRKALMELVENHEILRTRFIRKGNDVHQEVVEVGHASSVLNMIDFCDAVPNAWVERLNADASLPFDLAGGAPIRLCLYRIASRCHILTVIFSHFILDAVGFSVLMREAVRYYRQYALRQRPIGREERPQYADYCDWERRRLGAPDLLSSSAHYWASVLSPPPARLALNTSRRPVFKSYSGSSIAAEATRQSTLRTASELKATRFAVLLSIFIQLLYLETRERDVVVGAPFGVRNHPDTMEMVGFFLNVLPIRVGITADMTIAELIYAVSSRIGDARTHKHYPFESIVANSCKGFTLDRSPLFDVMFTLRDSHSGPWSSDGLTCKPISLSAVAAKYDLTMYVRDLGTAFIIEAEYNSDLIDSMRAKLLLDRYVTLLNQLDAAAKVETHQ
jgi:hypothetical protein